MEPGPICPFLHQRSLLCLTLATTLISLSSPIVLQGRDANTDPDARFLCRHTQRLRSRRGGDKSDGGRIARARVDESNEIKGTNSFSYSFFLLRYPTHPSCINQISFLSLSLSLGFLYQILSLVAHIPTFPCSPTCRIMLPQTNRNYDVY